VKSCTSSWLLCYEWPDRYYYTWIKEAGRQFQHGRGRGRAEIMKAQEFSPAFGTRLGGGCGIGNDLERLIECWAVIFSLSRVKDRDYSIFAIA